MTARIDEHIIVFVASVNERGLVADWNYIILRNACKANARQYAVWFFK
ncbi:hypothetical protein KQ246_18330 (plasmid) [Pseudoalteromonas shioyasakiensis]|nr:hypothetical protein [Pseudoalteromonas gelatinilytica]QWV06997.1 hypothetical protein KQ246_18330 [Pseudoalteromonas shioyasakiensis]